MSDALDKFEQAVSRVAQLHSQYMGKAMTDAVYDTFATLRDDTIPAFRKELRAALAQPETRPSAEVLEAARAVAKVWDEHGYPTEIHALSLPLNRLSHALSVCATEGGDKDAEIARLNAIINTPHADDFLKAVSIEGEHQRQRFGAEGDAGKTPADWFWLVGYLAGKALHAHAAGNTEKAEHHIITTAAACANWHRALFGKTGMRPGIDAALAAREGKAT